MTTSPDYLCRACGNITSFLNISLDSNRSSLEMYLACANVSVSRTYIHKALNH